MAGLYGVLDMCKWATLSQQTNIEVIGHNIANVNTPGYSRQKVLLETGTPLTTFVGQMGTGVKAVGVQREYDKYINAQLNFEKQILGNWEAQDYNFQRIEGIFNETSEYGLSATMNEFWNAWQALADNSSGRAERVGLLSIGETLAGDFNKMYEELQTIQTDINSSVKEGVDDINALVDQIVELNEKISSIELGEVQANDLRDQRDARLDELAEKIGCTSFEDDVGQTTIFLENGNPLVQGRMGWHLVVDVDPTNSNFYDVSWDDGTGTLTNITGSINRGELSGLLEMRDTVISTYLKKVDKLAAGIINEVNKLHYYGYGLDSSTENNFFNPLSVSTDISADNTGGASISAGTVYDNTVLTLDDYEIRFTAADRYTVYNVTENTAVTAGYVINADNNTIYFDEGGGELTATLGTGNYNASEMAAEIERALEAAGALDYTVTYDATAESFAISGSANFDILWQSGNGGAGSLAAETLGFDGTADDSGAAGYTSDFAANHTYISGHNISFEGITVAITDGATGPASGDIFTVNSTEGAAKNTTVNSVIVNDVNKIAASEDSVGDDNLNALAIAALRDGNYMNNHTSTFDSYYNGVVGEVGVEVNSSSRTLLYKQTMIDQLTTRKESISGVNLDEEMANLIRYQQAYTAAARMIGAVDEMLTELLNII
jgi:flagellar hook-associated protein 1 FlgK